MVCLGKGVSRRYHYEVDSVSKDWRDKVLEEHGNVVKIDWSQPEERKEPATLGWDDDEDDDQIVCGHMDEHSALIACGAKVVLFHKEDGKLVVLVCHGREILDEYVFDL